MAMHYFFRKLPPINSDSSCVDVLNFRKTPGDKGGHLPSDWLM